MCSSLNITINIIKKNFLGDFFLVRLYNLVPSRKIFLLLRHCRFLGDPFYVYLYFVKTILQYFCHSPAIVTSYSYHINHESNLSTHYAEFYVDMYKAYADNLVCVPETWKLLFSIFAIFFLLFKQPFITFLYSRSYLKKYILDNTLTVMLNEKKSLIHFVFLCAFKNYFVNRCSLLLQFFSIHFLHTWNKIWLVTCKFVIINSKIFLCVVNYGEMLFFMGVRVIMRFKQLQKVYVILLCGIFKGNNLHIMLYWPYDE